MSEVSLQEYKRGPLFLIYAIILTALAGGLGWGIRGQYGHESGATMAASLTAMALVLLYAPRTASSLQAARCAAMMAFAIGIGGSMTYGQTVGLTHNAEVIGNTSALRWGLIGLFLKGALWIGYGGVFLGMGMSGKKYRASEILLIMLAMLGLTFLGIWLYNTPFDVENKQVPNIYFSEEWGYYPDKEEVKPRPEVWGGNLVAITCLLIYVRAFRKDKLAFRMGLIALLGGGLGFSLGQCIQSYHAWHPEVFKEGGALGEYAELFKNFNWWNMMETTFGMIYGSALAIGLWFNQKLIKMEESSEQVTIPLTLEMVLMFIHLIILINTEFIFLPGKGIYLVTYIQFGMIMATIPLVAVIGGRIWPYFGLLTVIGMPIMGKTLRNLAYESEKIPVSLGWLTLVEIPIAVTVIAATLLTLKSLKNQSARQFSAIMLSLITIMYFYLNTCFFEHTWPWDEKWTGRTPNQLIYMVCVGTILISTFVYGMKSLKEKPNLETS